MNRVPLKNLIGWILVIILPLIIYLTMNPAHFSNSIRLFTVIGTITLLMMVLRLVPDFVAATGMLLLCLLLDIAPQQVIFSGFSSDVFFMCVGIFSLAAAVAYSGFLYRFCLIILQYLPKSSYVNNGVLFFIGILLTAVIPSPLGRAALMNPLMLEFVTNDKKSKKSKTDCTSLMLSNLHGTTILTTLFLTGNPLNFIMLGFFSFQTQLRFNWINWFHATVPIMLILITGFSLLMIKQISKNKIRPLSIEEIKQLLHNRGHVKSVEWCAAVAIVVFCIGIVTKPLHQIELTWISLGIAISLFLVNAITVKEFRTGIDWATLFYIASIAALYQIMNHIGLTDLLIDQCSRISQFFDSGFYAGTIIVIGGILMLRLILPGGPTFLILIAGLIPVSLKTGISPWVLGFVALYISESFILPYQYGTYSQLVNEVETSQLQLTYRKNDILSINMQVMLLKIAALLVAIPYWKYIALLK
jgi:di/tricarboxylate transporter